MCSITPSIKFYALSVLFELDYEGIIVISNFNLKDNFVKG